LPEYRQSIREYIRAADALLQTSDLTDEERRLVKEVVNKIPVEILDGHINGHDRFQGKVHLWLTVGEFRKGNVLFYF
jgi:hypothetical protein